MGEVVDVTMETDRAGQHWVVLAVQGLERHKRSGMTLPTTENAPDDGAAVLSTADATALQLRLGDLLAQHAKESGQR